ncbi:MAG: Sporulation protein RMD1 (Required for meiotic nuclear divisionprotein 1) [uncultured bacterium]|nr:MAG: Sporulation protein RMD1 (Required for meiotic nuclear divisionprotein 1) [uncultured bacterium]
MQNIKALRSFLRCTSFCTAATYDLLGLASFFKKKGYFTRLSKDVLHVANLKRQGDIFFFNYGCFVCWGFKKNFEDKLLEHVREFSVHPLAAIETDHLYYRYGEETTLDTHERLRLDVITLESEDVQIKLAFSYSLSQSIKLEAFEEAIKDAIKKNSYLPEEISSRGTISLSRRAIFKRMGEIFLARSSINLNIEYLDVPEFFWRNPNLEPFYIMMKKFLDIPSRVMALNQKLDVLQELLDILNTQIQHRHSSLLESIIIVLIVVEIVISLFQFHVV